MPVSAPPSPNNRAHFGLPAVAALSCNVGVVGSGACLCNCAWSHTRETDSLVPVCGDTTPGGPLRSTWGISLSEDPLGARARVLNTKVAHRANIPPMNDSSECRPRCPLCSILRLPGQTTTCWGVCWSTVGDCGGATEGLPRPCNGGLSVLRVCWRRWSRMHLLGCRVLLGVVDGR